MQRCQHATLTTDGFEEVPKFGVLSPLACLAIRRCRYSRLIGASVATDVTSACIIHGVNVNFSLATEHKDDRVLQSQNLNLITWTEVHVREIRGGILKCRFPQAKIELV
jgi:hypothetical protein